ncbi:hypothetical protein NicSoilC5_07440 [Arthrobacter sp. NicSoilC5]|nr:hypothetical protein NicSoilC5_07440 [Arthrobacter sp. NicSoilC5]
MGQRRLNKDPGHGKVPCHGNASGQGACREALQQGRLHGTVSNHCGYLRSAAGLDRDSKSRGTDSGLPACPDGIPACAVGLQLQRG